MHLQLVNHLRKAREPRKGEATRYPSHSFANTKIPQFRQYYLRFHSLANTKSIISSLYGPGQLTHYRPGATFHKSARRCVFCGSVLNQGFQTREPQCPDIKLKMVLCESFADSFERTELQAARASFRKIRLCGPNYGKRGEIYSNHIQKIRTWWTMPVAMPADSSILGTNLRADFASSI